jgi:uncharacterized protein YutE (UPF0331/DUF86 family)
MTNSALVLHKASRVRGRLLRVRDGLTVGRDAFAGETGRIEQVAFNIFLAMQECLDLASHIVSDQGWGTPATLAETFDLLEQHGVLTTDIAQAMRRGTRLRNLIAHAYGDLDGAKLFDAASAGQVQIEEFLAEIAGWMARSAVRGPG